MNYLTALRRFNVNVRLFHIAAAVIGFTNFGEPSFFSNQRLADYVWRRGIIELFTHVKGVKKISPQNCLWGEFALINMLLTGWGLRWRPVIPWDLSQQ